MAVCESGYLKSMTLLTNEGITNMRPDSAEVLLGTCDAVFFYVGPFCYPATNCGLLFSASIENEHGPDGASATPFDSGGLAKHLSWPSKGLETAREFFERHELPVPEHREYLRESLQCLFAHPEDYLDSDPESIHSGPIGLAGGDRRRWTHEVRIPGRITLRSPYLRAVFASRNRVRVVTEMEELFNWCLEHGVDRRMFDAPEGDEFAGLRRECLEYLRETIY